MKIKHIILKGSIETFPHYMENNFVMESYPVRSDYDLVVTLRLFAL